LRAHRHLYCAASLAVLAHRLHFFQAFVRLEICPCYDLRDLLAKFQKDVMGMVMRAHAAMSPMVTFWTGLDIDERQFWFLLEPTRVSWRYWLYNTTNRMTLPTKHWNRYRHWRHIPPHRMRETFGPRL
jgi:hypothetical protein